MEGLAKLAASFDARRNKQYWQMLKRLHGGTEEAVAAMKESGDDGIWHGTRKEFLPEIETEGLKPGRFREFGKGTFFGNEEIAKLYGSDEVRSGNVRMGNLINKETGEYIVNQQEMVDYIKNHPDSEYEINEGTLVRLAKPSELKGTKLLYPNVNKVKVFDIKTPNDLDKIAPSQTRYMAEHDDGVKRATNIALNRFYDAPPEEQRKVLEEIAKKQYDPEMMIYKNRSPEEMAEARNEYVEDGLKNIDDVIFHVKRSFGKELADKLMVPRNEKEMNQLQYYGKLRGRRVFDRLNDESIRKEMFVDHEAVGPELLRHEDGRLFDNSNYKGDKSGRSEAEANQGIATRIRDKGLWPFIGVGTGIAGGGLAYAAYKNKSKNEVK